MDLLAHSEGTLPARDYDCQSTEIVGRNASRTRTSVCALQRPSGARALRLCRPVRAATGSSSTRHAAAFWASPVPGPGSAAYDPATNTWTALPPAPAFPPPPVNGSAAPTGTADQRLGGLTVWTGSAVVLVGGEDHATQGARTDGLTWTPAA